MRFHHRRTYPRLLVFARKPSARAVCTHHRSVGCAVRPLRSWSPERAAFTFVLRERSFERALIVPTVLPVVDALVSGALGWSSGAR
jgi:hypothetical protein